MYLDFSTGFGGKKKKKAKVKQKSKGQDGEGGGTEEEGTGDGKGLAWTAKAEAPMLWWWETDEAARVPWGLARLLGLLLRWSMMVFSALGVFFSARLPSSSTRDIVHTFTIHKCVPFLLQTFAMNTARGAFSVSIAITKYNSYPVSPRDPEAFRVYIVNCVALP